MAAVCDTQAAGSMGRTGSPAETRPRTEEEKTCDVRLCEMKQLDRNMFETSQ